MAGGNLARDNAPFRTLQTVGAKLSYQTLSSKRGV
jgi:hypothetical protein